jgi:hypothetical protein
MLRATPQGLNGIPEWKGWPGLGPINQAAVNARWAEIGAPPPPPLVPDELIGLYAIPTRGPRMFAPTRHGKTFGMSKFKDGKKVNDFFNYWGKVAVDPYRKQSGISKVAGAILQVASVALPALGIAQAAIAGGNMALQANAADSFAKLQDRTLAPAVDAFNAQQDAESAAQTAAQIAKIRAAGNVATPAARTVLGVSLNRNEQIAVGALGAGLLIYLLARKRT